MPGRKNTRYILLRPLHGGACRVLPGTAVQTAEIMKICFVFAKGHFFTRCNLRTGE